MYGSKLKKKIFFMFYWKILFWVSDFAAPFNTTDFSCRLGDSVVLLWMKELLLECDVKEDKADPGPCPP